MKVIGTKELNRQLRRLPDEVEAEMRKVVKKSGSEFVTVARALVPTATGELRETIKAKYTDRGMTAEITAGGTDRDGIAKAKAVEGGRSPTSKSGGTEAQPYMNRAAKHLAKKINGRFKRAFSKAAKRVSNG